MPSYPPEETQPVCVTVFYAIVFIFAVIGVFSTLGFFQNLNQQALLANEQTITTNVTITEINFNSNGRYATGFVDSNGKGYVLNSVYTFSRMDTLVVGHTYTIKYFCNPLDNNDRTVMEMIDHATNPYTCVTENGVCK
jgi:hypothetical protein